MSKRYVTLLQAISEIHICVTLPVLSLIQVNKDVHLLHVLIAHAI